MKINISNLSEGKHECRLSSDPGDIGLGEQFSSKVHVSVTLDKSSRQLYLKASVQTTGVFHCDRCVDQFQKRLVNSYHMFYVYHEVDRRRHKADEVQFISPDMNEIDISEDVRQYVMLAVPFKLLCQENCAGLCPRCGQNLNHAQCSCTCKEIDPRWEGLQKLLKN